MNEQRVTVSPRADVLAEEYKGRYLWAEIDRLRAALEQMLEMYDRHSGWCGYNKNAPGDSIHHTATDLARAVLAGPAVLNEPEDELRPQALNPDGSSDDRAAGMRHGVPGPLNTATLSEPESKHLQPSEPGQGSRSSGASSGDERNSRRRVTRQTQVCSETWASIQNSKPAR